MFHIRRSQFIRVYGPGAIYEGKEAPYVILSLEAAEGFDFSTYRMDDPVLSAYLQSILLDNFNNWKTPVALELPYSTQEQRGIFLKAKKFQRWYLCPKHGYLWKEEENPGNGGKTFCPGCRDYRTSTGNSSPVRFIMICNKGHMDDLPWDELVHHSGRGGRRNCKNKVFKWEGKGVNVKIRCEKCGAEIQLSDIYGLSNRGGIECTGRRPEKELGNGPFTEDCRELAKIVLRMASNVRIPEVVSLLMVWPRSNELEQILSSNNFSVLLGRLYEVLRNLSEENYQEIKHRVENILKEELRNRNQEYRLLIDNIEGHSRNGRPRIFTFKETVEKVYEFRREIPEYSPKKILDMELEYLKKAAEEGASETDLITGRKYLEINNGRKLTAGGLLIAPLDTLTALEVQIAYRRYDPDNGKPMSVGAERPNDRNVYYPAIRLTGEGIFFYLRDINLQGEHAKTWWKAYEMVKDGQFHNYRDNIFRFRDEKYELHPAFVFLHTLSHLVVKAISMYAGYPMASLRERVYLDLDRDGKRGEGGIVIYTATENEGGAMGGLVSLVREDSLRKIFEIVVHMAGYCSNDPVCRDSRFEPGKVAGASCYACTILPETSCEYRNLWLDRHLILENEGIIKEVINAL